MTLRSDDEKLGTLKPEELMTSETKKGLYSIIGTLPNRRIQSPGQAEGFSLVEIAGITIQAIQHSFE